jgi:hypothetical protein
MNSLFFYENKNNKKAATKILVLIKLNLFSIYTTNTIPRRFEGELLILIWKIVDKSM